jgi:hypothetical protein
MSEALYLKPWELVIFFRAAVVTCNKHCFHEFSKQKFAQQSINCNRTSKILMVTEHPGSQIDKIIIDSTRKNVCT